MSTLRFLNMFTIIAFLNGCGGTYDTGDNTDDDTSDDDDDIGDDDVPDDDEGGSSQFELTVEEVNSGDGVGTYAGTTDVPNGDFGATIEDGRLTVVVKDDDIKCEAAVTTADGNSVPGSFQTDSGFTDSAWVSFRADNTHYDMQNSGQLSFDACPAVGEMVTATLVDVRLASSVSNSIKLINGTMTVEVVEDDGTLICN